MLPVSSRRPSAASVALVAIRTVCGECMHVPCERVWLLLVWSWWPLRDPQRLPCPYNRVAPVLGLPQARVCFPIKRIHVACSRATKRDLFAVAALVDCTNHRPSTFSYI